MKNTPAHRVYYIGSFISLVLAIVVSYIFQNLEINGGPAIILFGFTAISHFIIGLLYVRKHKHNTESGA